MEFARAFLANRSGDDAQRIIDVLPLDDALGIANFRQAPEQLLHPRVVSQLAGE